MTTPLDPKEKKGGPTMTAFVPGTAVNATSTVEISISCRNLINADLLSKSDPMVVIYNRPPGSKTWVQFMRTEAINDDLNPDFVAKAMMNYRFEQVQALRFEVYDIDAKSDDLSVHDKLGMAEMSLGQIVSAGEEGLTVDLIPFSNYDKSAGTIILTAEELASEKDEVTLKILGSSIGRWSGLCPPRTFWSMSKLMYSSGKYVLIFRSRDSRGSNPAWQELKMSARNFCNGDLGREMKIEVFQRKYSGAVVKLGETLTSLSDMMKKDLSTDRFQLRAPDGQLTGSYVRVQSCKMEPINTFVEYIQCGCQITSCFAIDFTCSNGDPSDGESLHYLSKTSNQPNSYEQAIEAVGNIVKDYHNASLFPCYGFGARIPPEGEISHNFPLNFKTSANCESITGVLEEYRNCLSKIQLYAPTNFAPIINNVAHAASRIKPGDNYVILVIITDGVISDMQNTKKAIVAASIYPLSIIIIGVGEADFTLMEELDGDAVRVSYRGKMAARDIVQFVAYRSARSWLNNTGEKTVSNLEGIGGDEEEEEAGANKDGRPKGDQQQQQREGEREKKPKIQAPQVVTFEDKDDRTNRLAQSQLAKEVLEEIPAQLTSYMKSQGIKPNMIRKPKPQSESEGKR